VGRCPSVSSCSGPDSLPPIPHSSIHINSPPPINHLESSNHRWVDARCFFKTTFGAKQASNAGPVPPREQQSTSNKLSDCRLHPMRRSETGPINQDQLDQAGSTGSTAVAWQHSHQEIDSSSRLLRTRYRTGQLDTWFWVVLLRVLRFPPHFFKKRKEKS